MGNGFPRCIEQERQIKSLAYEIKHAATLYQAAPGIIKYAPLSLCCFNCAGATFTVGTLVFLYVLKYR